MEPLDFLRAVRRRWRVVVGASFDDTGATNAGSAYVYDLNSGTPTLPVATLIDPSPVASDLFGTSVAIDGTTIATGAPYNDTTGLDRGAAYVFTPAACLEPNMADMILPKTLIFSSWPQRGGVYLNIGSAVVLPEVFLKCVTLVRNLGYELNDITTA